MAGVAAPEATEAAALKKVVDPDFEAEILASELRIKAEQEGRAVEVEHTAAIRQCEWEYLDMIAEKIEQADVVLIMACGIGIQSLAEKFAPKLVMPAVNTN